MKLRDIKVLAAGVIVVSLVTTNFIIPSILEEAPVLPEMALRVTAISKPVPIGAQAVPEPFKVLSPAEATARAAAMQAHADRVLAENGELPDQQMAGYCLADQQMAGQAVAGRPLPDAPLSTLKCVAGCD